MENMSGAKKAFLEICLAAIKSVQAARESGAVTNFGMAIAYIDSAEVILRTNPNILTSKERNRFDEVKATVKKAQEKAWEELTIEG